MCERSVGDRAALVGAGGTVLEGRPLRGQEEEVRGFPAGPPPAPRVASQGQPEGQRSRKQRGLRKPAGPGTGWAPNAGKRGPSSHRRDVKGSPLTVDAAVCKLGNKCQMRSRTPTGLPRGQDVSCTPRKDGRSSGGPRRAQGRDPPMKAEPLPPSPSRAPQSRSNERPSGAPQSRSNERPSVGADKGGSLPRPGDSAGGQEAVSSQDLCPPDPHAIST